MKYLIIAQNYPPEIGPVRYTYDLANSLNEQGHNITVITGIPHYPTNNVYPEFVRNKVSVKNENGIEVIRTPLLLASNTQPIKRILGFITFFFSAIPQLLKNMDAHLLIVSIPPLNVLFLGILTKLLFRIPFIALLRDFEPYSTFNTRGLLNNRFLYIVTKLISKLYKYADAVVVVHSDQILTINKLGLSFKTLKVLSHPVQLDRYNLKLDSNINSNKNIGSRNLRCVYVGTFGRIHALPQLIKSLISRKISLLPINFDFFGDGEESQECKKIINESTDHDVRIYDLIPFEQVYEKLINADFLIYSISSDNQFDGVGSKFYEYFASAKPILVCGKCNVMEIVKQLGNGWWVDSPDPEILYDCLKKIVNDKSEFNNMGERGRDYIKKYSSYNSFRENWNDLCRSLLKTQ